MAGEGFYLKSGTILLDGRTRSSIMKDWAFKQRELACLIVRKAPITQIEALLDDVPDIIPAVTEGTTPLHYAVWQDYFDAAVLLLQRGCEINSFNDCGYSPLHLAAEDGSIEFVELLLSQGAQVNFYAEIKDDFPVLTDTPLRLAVQNGHYEVAKALLEYGADPNQSNFNGTLLNQITDPNFAGLLLAFGAYPDMLDRSGLTPLMKAARSLNSMELVVLLVSYGADVNARCDGRKDFQTVLHFAVQSGDTDKVLYLMSKGARLKYACLDRSVPHLLDLAVFKGQVNMIRLLIRSGAFVNTPSGVVGSPLHVACSGGIPNRHSIIKILLVAGADPNQVVLNMKNEPLICCLAEYLVSDRVLNIDIVRMLLKHGARVIMKSQHQHPLGILNYLYNLSLKENRGIMDLLLQAVEPYDMVAVCQTNTMSVDLKEKLVRVGSRPFSLKHQAKVEIRRTYGHFLPRVIDKDMPKTLANYLLIQ